MAKEMEPQRWARDVDLDQGVGQDVDQAALLAAILAQREGQAVPVSGPEWTSMVRPPAIPGTFQDKYAKVMTPVRAIAFGVLWATWDWKRGGFVVLVLILIVAIIKTR